jgi:hypothetical protein
MTKVRHDVACVVAFRLNAITDNVEFRVVPLPDEGLSVVVFKSLFGKDTEVFIDRHGLTPWDTFFAVDGEDNDG